MQINEQDFYSFITIKEGLDINSVRHCMIRVRIINKSLESKELSKEFVEMFFAALKQKGLKNNSLNTYRFVFRHLVSYCKDRGFKSDFFEGFKSFKKTKPEIVIFTPEEIERIINTKLTYGHFHGKDTSFLDYRYRTLTMFLAFTGTRFSEAATLKVKYVDLSAGRASLVHTKTNENRSVYFVEPLTSKLKKIIDGKNPDDYVFRNALEKPINAQDYSSDLKKRALSAGVTKRVFPHNFRHSYITQLLETGVPITEVASLVGHKDIQTTYDTYMHLADKTLMRAALKHPLVRKHVDPNEIIETVKAAIENLKLKGDKRFDYSLVEEGSSIKFVLALKA